MTTGMTIQSTKMSTRKQAQLGLFSCAHFVIQMKKQGPYLTVSGGGMDSMFRV